MAGVSLRKSIRWLPHDAHEPTSTMVLSSVGRKFVDLRFLLPSLTSEGEPIANIYPGRLDWAIAGSSTSIAIPDRGPNTKLSRFEHWIDSRTLEPALATDEGVMTPAGFDGGRELVLEVGRMVNPDTGLMTDYEEVWIEKAPEPVPGETSCQILVLQYNGEGSDHRGSVVRIGRYCQGLLRIKDQIYAERWEWSEGKNWSRTEAMGDVNVLPCEKILKSFPTGTVEHHGMSWTVIENSQI